MIKRVLKNQLYRFGVMMNGVSATAPVHELIAKMRPFDVGIPLVRVGDSGDGGYLVPDDFSGITTCFSPGIGPVVRFEEDLASKGIKCFLADASVENPKKNDPSFVYEPKFLRASPDKISITLEDWFTRASVAGDSILQMDIEGFEFEVLLSTPQNVINRFRIIVLELHALDRLLDPFVFGFMQKAFEKVLMNHTVVHLHPNNNGALFQYKDLQIPSSLEITFIRNDRVKNKTPQTKFPHSLDRKNVEKYPDMILPECWYR